MLKLNLNDREWAKQKNGIEDASHNDCDFLNVVETFLQWKHFEKENNLLRKRKRNRFWINDNKYIILLKLLAVV